VLNQSKNISLNIPNLTVGDTDTFVMENTQQIVQNKVFKDFVGSNTPTINVSGLNIFSEYKSGRRMLAQKANGFNPYPFQPFFGSKKVGIWTANGSSATPTVFGMGNTASGAVSTNTNTSLGVIGTTRRIAYTTSATANSVAGYSHGLAQFMIGDIPKRGGFYYTVRFFISSVSTVANQFFFVGLMADNLLTSTASPSAYINMLGFGADPAGNLVFFHNDGAGTATSEPLTGTFPPRNFISASSPIYETRIYCQPNGSTIYYSIEDLNNGGYYGSSVSIANNCPGISTMLCPKIVTGNGATALAASISVISQYIETEL